jgi:hypothetical protein
LIKLNPLDGQTFKWIALVTLDGFPSRCAGVQMICCAPFYALHRVIRGQGDISYGIIREHGGTIRLENNQEERVSILIDLPVGGSATG